ncbi:DUF305 domain-containing protein [Psychrobacter sp. 72-O-c]|uniref:CopM family metallochaperone n=1 Tax=Psychrobacter sp. 72-O-c TaxID=2774125 RepID=UPI0019189008|nr:DUF305 domain-containing protein [Psychrobacter sp. 72-O-c]
MFIYRRFVLFAAVLSATFALYGCQPTTEDTVATPTEEIMPPPIEVPESDADAMDPNAGHDMMDGEMMADDAQMTDVLKDYTKSMSKMHDEMMVSINYNDPDTAFAKGMLGHHRGAVDMAEIELKYGTDTEMLKLAQEIITAQQTEIDTLKKWLASHPDSANPKPDTAAMQKAYADGLNAMHGEMMLGIADPVPDVAFARGMLPHHIGAVDMAKVQLKYGTDEEMRKLAQNIIDAQQPEIKLMQNWIATYGAEDGVTPNNAKTSSDSKEALEPTKINKPSA